MRPISIKSRVKLMALGNTLYFCHDWVEFTKDHFCQEKNPLVEHLVGVHKHLVSKEEYAQFGFVTIVLKENLIKGGEKAIHHP